jgi:hypothetical protein
MAPLLSRLGVGNGGFGFGNIKKVSSTSSTGNATITTASVVGFWPFKDDLNADIGSHTTTAYGGVTSIQSSVKKWSDYSNSLLMSGSASTSTGLRLSSATNWTWASGKTLEMWFYPIDPPNVTNTTPGRFVVWGDRGDNVCFMVDRDTTDGTLYGRTNVTYVQLGTEATVLNSWNWIVVSRSGTEIKVFVNGILSYTNANGFGGNGYASDGQYFHILGDYDTGYGSNPAFSRNGYAQDVIVYNEIPFHSMSSIDLPTISTTDRIV